MNKITEILIVAILVPIFAFAWFGLGYYLEQRGLIGIWIFIAFLLGLFVVFYRP